MIIHCRYDPGPDPLKNIRPFIPLTRTGVNVNLILNTTVTPDENILIAQNVVRPGIVYATFIVEDVSAAAEALRAAGVLVVSESEMATSKWACLASRFVPSHDGLSVFIEDLDYSIIRLMNAPPEADTP